jgi:hypothetical protein
MAWGAASWALRDIHFIARETYRAAKHRDLGRLFSEGQALKVRRWRLALRMTSIHKKKDQIMFARNDA